MLILQTRTDPTQTNGTSFPSGQSGVTGKTYIKHFILGSSVTLSTDEFSVKSVEVV